MSVRSVSSSSNMLIEATESTVNNESSEMNSSDFIQLLMIQYQNQDPLDPVDDTEFIAQMAEFSTMDLMEQMVGSQQSSQMYSMLGKEIIYDVTDEATGSQRSYSGIVDSVITTNGVSQLCVNGDCINLDQVISVTASTKEGSDS